MDIAETESFYIPSLCVACSLLGFCDDGHIFDK